MDRLSSSSLRLVFQDIYVNIIFSGLCWLTPLMLNGPAHKLSVHMQCFICVFHSHMVCILFTEAASLWSVWPVWSQYVSMPEPFVLQL